MQLDRYLDHWPLVDAVFDDAVTCPVERCVELAQFYADPKVTLRDDRVETAFAKFATTGAIKSSVSPCNPMIEPMSRSSSQSMKAPSRTAPRHVSCHKKNTTSKSSRTDFASLSTLLATDISIGTITAGFVSKGLGSDMVTHYFAER